MGLSLISVSAPSTPDQLRLNNLLDGDRRVVLKRRRRGAGGDSLCDHGLVGIDGDVLHHDLLLATPSMAPRHGHDRGCHPLSPVSYFKRSIGDRTVAFCAGKRREHRRLCGLIISRADDVMILGHDLAVADSLVSIPSEPISLVLLKRGEPFLAGRPIRGEPSMSPAGSESKAKTIAGQLPNRLPMRDSALGAASGLCTEHATPLHPLRLRPPTAVTPTLQWHTARRP
jgi:hypothetical protein